MQRANLFALFSVRASKINLIIILWMFKFHLIFIFLDSKRFSSWISNLVSLTARSPKTNNQPSTPLFGWHCTTTSDFLMYASWNNTSIIYVYTRAPVVHGNNHPDFKAFNRECSAAPQTSAKTNYRTHERSLSYLTDIVRVLQLRMWFAASKRARSSLLRRCPSIHSLCFCFS